MFFGSLHHLYLITGTCFVLTLFLPFLVTCRSNANTISGLRSKYPISFFQLVPHLQCFKPMNCCTMARPQFGHLRLFAVATAIPHFLLSIHYTKHA